MREVGGANQNGINAIIVGEVIETGVDGWCFMSRLSEFADCTVNASGVFIENADDTRLL